MIFQVIPMPPKTLSWWLDEWEGIDFEPVYQRKGHIWSPGQKQFLIDSILNNFDVPKLYLADFTFLNSNLNVNKKKYAVIDGKQRLLAVHDFFNDKITLPRDFSLFDQPELRLSGFSYSDLVKNHPKVARKFDNASLTIMSVITDNESKINELFVRLNSSKPLTGAELRNAMVGNVPALIRDLASHDFFATRVRFNTNRSQDKNTAAKLLLLEHRGSIVDTKKQQLDTLIDELGDEDVEAVEAVDGSTTKADRELVDALENVLEETENPSIERSSDRVRAVLDRMCHIFIPADPLLRQQAQIVVIYWLVRSFGEDELNSVRAFLLHFEAVRAANKADGGGNDPELAEFELMSRTSNDASSIRVRHKILLDRFYSFLSVMA